MNFRPFFIVLSYSVILICGFKDCSQKNIYFFGDSITAGYQIANPYTRLVAENLGMRIIKNSPPYAFEGTTMMHQYPYNILNKDGHSMEFWSREPNMSKFNAGRDGLIFVAYLTNDVGLNLPNYSAKNFSIAVENVINGLLRAGWPKDRIKFNIRYFITNKGLDYSNTIETVKTPATLDRYNEFAQILKSKLDRNGIQYFDFWDELSAQKNPVSHLDNKQRHIDQASHCIVAKHILDQIQFKK